MKYNNDKHKQLVTGQDNSIMKIGTEIIENNSSLKLLAIIIERNLMDINIKYKI